MKIRDYLKDKGSFLVINIILFFIVGGIMLYAGIKPVIVFCMLMSWFIPFLSYLIIELVRSKKYYDNIQEILRDLDKKYLLPELLEETDFIHGRILNEILKEVSRAMHENINYYRDIQSEYREYIETWVHEIKTPIASTKLIIENHENDITNKIDTQVERIENFVEQVLYYSRSDDVSKDYIIKETGLEEIINEVIRKNYRDFMNKKIKLGLNDIDHRVYTDIKWIKFILNQIIGNAMKYSIGKEKAINIYAQEKDNAIIVTIEDYGVGISEKDINRVFEKGFTGDNGRRFGRSTGMGLYLCKNLCTKLGIGIDIVSKVDEGTKVSIIFPKLNHLE